MSRLVVFDLDDTLYPERDFVLGGFRAAAGVLAAELGIPPRRALGAMLRAFRGGSGGVFDRVLAELAPDRADLAPRLVHAYREHPPTLRLPAESERALTWARGRGHLALVSDGIAAQQRRKLAALGLTERFDLLLLTGELGEGWGKPSVKPFQRALDHFGVEPSAAVYLSDNPAKDFRGPNLLGLRSVRVRRPRGVYARLEPAPGWEPTAEAPNLDAAIRRLESWGW